MSTLVITPHKRAKIEVLIAFARENVIPFSVLAQSAIITEGNEITLADRKSVPKRPEPRHIMLGTIEAAISFEEQPAGICRHLSVAVGKKGKLPHPEAVKVVAEAFGFTAFPPVDGRVWIEEYEPGMHAINVVEVAEPAAPGTMQ